MSAYALGGAYQRVLRVRGEQRGYPGAQRGVGLARARPHAVVHVVRAAADRHFERLQQRFLCGCRWGPTRARVYVCARGARVHVCVRVCVRARVCMRVCCGYGWYACARVRVRGLRSWCVRARMCAHRSQRPRTGDRSRRRLG